MIPAIPAMPASTTPAIADAASSFISSMAGPIELIVGIFVAFLVIAVIVGALGREPAEMDYDDVGD